MLLRITLCLLAFLPAGCIDGESTRSEPRRPVKCEMPAVWSASPEADWVRKIVEVGGYNVVGETGSALVVAGKSHEFNIWAAELGRPSPGMPNWRRMATVRGVPILGDRDGWRSWRAQGFTFWVHGGSLTPAAGRLAPIVDASLRIPFRDPCGA
jgi:hypothetical protein